MRSPLTALLAIVATFYPMLAWAAEPATTAEAAKRLDLRSLPVIAGAQMQGYRRLASLGYSSNKPTDEVFAFIDKQLTDRGWKQLPGAQNAQGFAGADYELDGFVVHASVYPRGGEGVGVTIDHKGNVPLDELPTPPGAEKLYAFTGIVMYKSPDAVDKTAAAVRERMTDAGWSPYGGAGDTDYFRKNAVLAHVRTMSSPGQGDATVINYSTEMLSLELPAPDFADGFRYSDGTTDTMFDCDKTAQEVADFYREALKPLGWTATTDKPFEDKWRLQTIFRNDGQEMLTVTTHEFEGRTRARVEHSNAHEVARDAYLAMSDAGEKAKYRDKKWMTVPLAIPAELPTEQDEKWALRLTTPRGQAFASAERLATSLESVGWTRDKEGKDRPVIREYRVKKADKVLWIQAVEPPVLEPWVGVVGLHGVEFKSRE